MAEFLKEYWDDIVALVDKIYIAIRDYIRSQNAAE